MCNDKFYKTVASFFFYFFRFFMHKTSKMILAVIKSQILIRLKTGIHDRELVVEWTIHILNFKEDISILVVYWHYLAKGTLRHCLTRNFSQFCTA